MSASDYDACEANVLASEGGYTNDPADPGGPTNWGITIYDARLYWKPDATAADVRAMPKSVAQDIYRKMYWNALDCDDLPAGLDYTVFDYGVNSGISRSGIVLRQKLGLPATAWQVDSSVLDAVAKHNTADLIEAINTERLQFLEGLRTWPVFGRGWGARVHSVDAISLHMALPAPPTVAPAAHVASADMPSGKGVHAITALTAHFDVAALQSALNMLGADPQLFVDDSYGPNTRSQVVAFQRTAELVPDGIAGDLTRQTINSKLAAFNAAHA